MSLTAPALIDGFFNTGATWETLLIGYIPIQNKKFNFKKKRKKSGSFFTVGRRYQTKENSITDLAWSEEGGWQRQRENKRGE